MTMSYSREASAQQLGSLGHSHVLLVLQLLSIITLLAALLVTILAQGFKDPRSQGKERIYQKLSQLKAGVDLLCRPCPWDWTFCQGKCYFFSNSKRNWHDAVTACQEVEAQLAIFETDEEMSFLEVISTDKGSTWIGLSDLKHEGTWLWLDGSSPSQSFIRYQKTKEFNNTEEKDCVEFNDFKWNADRCELEKFWICRKSAASCFSK